MLECRNDFRANLIQLGQIFSLTQTHSDTIYLIILLVHLKNLLQAADGSKAADLVRDSSTVFAGWKQKWTFPNVDGEKNIQVDTEVGNM